MKVLRVNINDLKINNMKLGMKTIDVFSYKMNLHSYGYLHKMNIVYRNCKNKNHKNFTLKYLEFYFNELTTKQMNNFIKKMKKVGISGDSKIGLWENDKLVSKVDFNTGEEPLKYNTKITKYIYHSSNIWFRK